MDIDWKEHFNRLAITEIEEHRKVGWGSKESMYSKFHVALSLLQLKEKQCLLDIGPGTGALEEMLTKKHPTLEIYAIDISENQMRLSRQRNPSVNFRIGSITDIPFPDLFFDCLTCIGVLQNFNGPLITAIGEMSRVLKKGGDIFVAAMDADYTGFKSGKRKPALLANYFVPEELKNLFEFAGISVARMEAISSTKLEGLIVPLHEQHTFFILGRK